MTNEQRARFTGRKTFRTISISSRIQGGRELTRVVSVNTKTNVLSIEFWTRKLTELSPKAFKRQATA